MLQAAIARNDHFNASNINVDTLERHTGDNSSEKNAPPPNANTNDLLVNYITKFSKQLRHDTVQCVLVSFIAAVQQLEQHVVKMEEGETDQNMAMLNWLNKFKENLPNWFNQRLIDNKLTCSGLTQTNIDAVTHHGFDQLLTAGPADLALQLQTQQNFDQALLQFKSMLMNAGFRTKSDLEKLPIASEVFRSNPVNLSTLIGPIINKLDGKSSTNWIFYRLFHTEIYARLPELYQSWQKNLRNYHRMLRTELAQ
jgi:hypothetical protein